MLRYDRFAFCIGVAAIIIRFLISQYQKSQNIVWIAASVLFACIVTVLFTFVILDIRNDHAERPLRRARAKLLRVGLPSYTYKPLDKSNPKSIRLIELWPWTEVDIDNGIYVRINMRIASLDGPDAEPYEALSYCWGDTNCLRPLVCDDAVIPVTASLHLALQRLHLEDRKRILWVDALSINQMDMEEKSSQVRMMSEIYRNATLVLAYLGEDENSSQDLEYFIHRLAKAEKCISEEIENETISPSSPLTPERQKELGIPSMTPFNSTQFIAMQRLLLRDWFHRVWIIQEIVLARDAIMLCGDWEIPWTTLIAAYRISKVLPVGGKDLVDLGVDRLERLVMSKENGPDSTLNQLLFVHRGARATNPRDHVYALLGLANDGDDFEVDYTKSVSQIFCDTARQILSSSRQLLLLSLVNHVPRDNDLTLPSWVPDWHAGITRTPLVEYMRDPTEAHLRFTSDGMGLVIFGIEMDSIVIQGDCTPDVTDGSEYRMWYELLYHSTFLNWFNLLQPFFDTSYAISGEPFHEAFWQMIAGNDPSFSMESRSLRIRILSFRLASWATSLPFSATSEKRQVLAFLFLFMPMFLVFRLFWRELTGSKYRPFPYAEYVTGRRMIRTKTGLLGLVPREAQIEDKIFLLDGGLTPMIVRQKGNDGNTYELIGECYLHKYMDKLATDLGECYEITLV